MEYKTIDDLGDLNGKVVMLRADLNVPMDENFHVTNTARIDRTVPTVKELMGKGAKVVVISHFGRPGRQGRPEEFAQPYCQGHGKGAWPQGCFC